MEFWNLILAKSFCVLEEDGLPSTAVETAPEGVREKWRPRGSSAFRKADAGRVYTIQKDNASVAHDFSQAPLSLVCKGILDKSCREYQHFHVKRGRLKISSVLAQWVHSLVLVFGNYLVNIPIHVQISEITGEEGTSGLRGKLPPLQSVSLAD